MKKPKHIKTHFVAVPQIQYVEALVNWVNSSRYKNLDLRVRPGKLLNIDFSKMKNIKPYHITPLACVIHEYLQKGYKIKLINQSGRVKQYMDSFNFNQFCEQNIEANNFPTPKYADTFPLWKIEQNASSIYPNKVQTYFEQNQFYGKDLFELGNSLGELMNNIFDHSNCKIPGFTFTQYDKKKEIITSVCDFGVGIPNKINQFLKANGLNKLTPIECLNKAIENKFSTKSTPRNKGLGLHTVISSVNELNGKVLIVSGKALFLSLPNGLVETKELAESFPGCLIVIYLNTDNLRLKADELNEELHII
jgi:hypothetical protein